MTTSNQQEGKLTDAELRSLRLLGQKHYGNSLYSDHITYQHELQTLIEQLIEAREEIAERKGRQEPVGDAIELDVDREVMQFVMSKIKLKSKSIASRTLVNEELVDRWRDGTADKYDLNVHIWKLRLLASMTHKYNWTVFLSKP